MAWNPGTFSEITVGTDALIQKYLLSLCLTRTLSGEVSHAMDEPLQKINEAPHETKEKEAINDEMFSQTINVLIFVLNDRIP